MITESIHVVRSTDGETTRVIRESGQGASEATVLALLAAKSEEDADTYLSYDADTEEILLDGTPIEINGLQVIDL